MTIKSRQQTRRRHCVRKCEHVELSNCWVGPIQLYVAGNETRIAATMQKKTQNKCRKQIMKKKTLG